jgi:hypothetical protein
MDQVGRRGLPVAANGFQNHPSPQRTIKTMVDLDRQCSLFLGHDLARVRADHLDCNAVLGQMLEQPDRIGAARPHFKPAGKQQNLQGIRHSSNFSVARL